MNKRIRVSGDSKTSTVSLLGLPRPVLTMCFSYLDMASGLSAAATCQACKTVCQSSKAWPDFLDFGDLPRNGVPLSTKTFERLSQFSLQPKRLHLECENIPIEPLRRLLDRMQPKAVRICGGSRFEMVPDWKHFLAQTEKLDLVHCHPMFPFDALGGVSAALTELDITSPELRDHHFAAVQATALGLTRLSVADCRLLECPLISNTVTFLNVSGCQLKAQFWDKQLPLLSSLKHLVMFNVSSSTFEPLDFQFLAQLKQLTALDVSGNFLSFGDLAHICKVDGLQSLKCGRLSHSQVQLLSDCKLPLKELEMFSTYPHTYDRSSDFATFPKLQSLTICVFHEVAPLRGLAHLTSLNLSCSPQLVALSELRHLPGLQTLKLAFCVFLENKDLAGVLFPSVTELDLQGCDLLTADLVPQLQLPKLKLLTANYHLLGSTAALDYVARIKLSRLTLYKCGSLAANLAVRQGLRRRKIAWWDAEFAYGSCHRLHSYLWSDDDLDPRGVAEYIYI